MEELRKEFQRKYNILSLYNSELAESEFECYLTDGDAEDLIAGLFSINEAIEEAQIASLIPDFVERPRLCRNEY